MTSTMIDRKTTSVAELFAGIRYTLREMASFDWQASDVLLKVGILLGAFQASYRPGHPFEAAENYPGVRLGTMMTLVDTDTPEEQTVLYGHQHLATLILVLWSLQGRNVNYNEVDDESSVWTYFRKRSCRMDDLGTTMENLYYGYEWDDKVSNHTSENIVKHSVRVDNALYGAIDDDAFPLFVHWLLHKVHLDEFRAHTEEGARRLQTWRNKLIYD